MKGILRELHNMSSIFSQSVQMICWGRIRDMVIGILNIVFLLICDKENNW